MSAERSRRLRERRRRGVQVVAPIELTDKAIKGLLAKGYLTSNTRGGENRVKREAILEAAQEFWNDALA